MITRESNEFYSRMQHYVFVDRNVEIDPTTNLPVDKRDWYIFDIDDCISYDFPLDKDFDPMILWAIVDDPEEIAKLKEMQKGRSITGRFYGEK